MSKEIIAKQTAGVLGAVIRQPHWEKAELEKGLKKVLVQIKEKSGSEEEYSETILRNVTFQFENTRAATAFLTHCIDDEKFLPQESFKSVLEDLPRKVTESKILDKNMSQFKELVYQGSTIEEQVLHAEKVFSQTKLANDLLVEFIGTFLQPDNRNFMEQFMEYSSSVLVEIVMDYCRGFSTHILNEINSANLKS